MANVLLLEPSDDVRELILWTLGRAGHDVSVELGDDPGGPAAIILEPADPVSLATAGALVAERPELPVICMSIQPPHPIDGLEPAAYLVKPFSLADLEAVLQQALMTAA